MIYAEPADRFIEERGGFTDVDTHVALLMSLPGIPPQQIRSFVRTAQIAPTILSQIGLDPRALQSVVKKHTPIAPGMGSHSAPPPVDESGRIGRYTQHFIKFRLPMQTAYFLAVPTNLEGVPLESARRISLRMKVFIGVASKRGNGSRIIACSSIHSASFCCSSLLGGLS
jgi:hypothetical protein